MLGVYGDGINKPITTISLKSRDAMLSVLEARDKECQESLSAVEGRLAFLETKFEDTSPFIDSTKANATHPLPGSVFSTKAASQLPKPSFADMVKQGSTPKPSKMPKKLSPEELGCIFQGLAPKPPRSINTVYSTGIRAQKISFLKSLLNDQYNVSLQTFSQSTSLVSL